MQTIGLPNHRFRNTPLTCFWENIGGWGHRDVPQLAPTQSSWMGNPEQLVLQRGLDKQGRQRDVICDRPDLLQRPKTSKPQKCIF